MLGYGPYHYVTRSGCEGDWPVVGLSSRKQYISLYVCACDAKGRYLAELSKSRLPQTSIGKSCIRFKRLDDLDWDFVAELLKQAEAWYHAQPASGKTGLSKASAGKATVPTKRKAGTTVASRTRKGTKPATQR